MLIHCEKNSDPIKITFNIIGAAAAIANLLYEFSIAPKKEAKHIKNRKGTVINPPPIPNKPATKPTGIAVNAINRLK